eukprot:1746710-Prymnesium_polylepis.1
MERELLDLVAADVADLRATYSTVGIAPLFTAASANVYRRSPLPLAAFSHALSLSALANVVHVLAAGWTLRKASAHVVHPGLEGLQQSDATPRAREALEGPQLAGAQACWRRV